MGTNTVLHKFIWYERYRPKVLSEMVLRKEYRVKFEDYIAEANIPHLLLYGPRGSGKTTLAYILIDAIGAQSLVLNASSSDRGVSAVKGKMTQFARSQPLDGRLKVLFLDESDSLTPDAQRALRNTMETYSDTCRFILTANYIDRVLPEIQSRCIHYEFSTLPRRKVEQLIVSIFNTEKISFTEKAVAFLVERFYPDVRSLINNAQAGSIGGHFMSSAVIGALAAEDPALLVRSIMAGELGKLRKLWVGVSDFGWLYRFLFDILIYEVKEELRPEIALAVCNYMYQDSIVSDREINFTGCVVELMKLMDVKIKWQAQEGVQGGSRKRQDTI